AAAPTPTRRRDHGLEPLARALRELLLRAGDEEAVGLLSSAANPPSELMELGKAESVGLLHDHDRGVRDVDADLDDRRRDENVELTRLEARHHASSLRRGKAAAW